MAERTIVLADHEIPVVRNLKRSLENDYDVLAARDGSKALELCLTREPDVVIVERRLPVIVAAQLIQILRTNPRTEEVPIILLSERQLAASQLPGYLQGVWVKPLNMDDVRARLAALFRKVDAAKRVGQEDGAVSGSLDQISMADLLQIFSVNHRTGSLQIKGPNQQEAEVFLSDGNIEDAVTGSARGDKALYRIAAWQTGRFAFVPGRRGTAVTIESSTDSLLMESMRISDELARLQAELPDPRARVDRLIPEEGLPDGLHPTTAEILELVQLYPRVGDLVDRATVNDLEVYLALRSLIDAGLVRVAEGRTKERRTVLTAEAIFALRSRLRRAGVAAAFISCPKLVVVAPGTEDLREVGAALAQVPGFAPGDLEAVVGSACGTVGRLALEEGLSLDVVALAPSEALLPLAFALTSGTIAAVVLGTGALDRLAPVVHLLEVERRAALIFGQRNGDPAPDIKDGQAIEEVTTLDEPTVRRLLGKALELACHEDLRGAQL